MAFPSGWANKCPLTIQYTRVPTAVVDQPILLVAANFPTGFLTQCNTDGSDIRFASDSLGTTPYPRDIVSFDVTNGYCTIYVKIPAISNTTNTTFWVFWGNSSANEPGVGDLSQNTLVWSKWYGVVHFKNVTTAWKGVKDTSGSWNGMTVIGTLPTTWPVGHAHGTIGFPQSTTLGLTLHELLSFAGNTMDFMFWVNFNGTHTTGDWGKGTNGIAYGWLAAGQFGVSWGLFSCTSGAVPATGWHHVVVSILAGTAKVYVDGVDKTQGTGTSSAVLFTTMGLGAATAPVFTMSEFRMTRNNQLTVGQITCMYNNESSPSTFVIAGTAQTNPITYTLTLTGLQLGSEVRIYSAGTTTELAGIESTITSSFSYTYTYTGNTLVDIVIMNLQYEYVSYKSYTLSGSNNSIPVQQQFDRNYYNP